MRRFLPLLALVALFLWGLNASYPKIGHDFGYTIGHLLGGRWHFLQQGLLPFRYSPHFCGGMPVYGGYAAMYYSLPQLLALIFDPWTAIQASIIAFLLAGFYGWYRFANHILGMERSWARLLAFVVVANGFSLLHMIVGHVSYISVSLLGLLLWLLLSPKEKTQKDLFTRSSFFGLLSALILYGGGYITILFTVIALLIALPIDLSLHRQAFACRLRTLLIRFCLFGGAALLLCISKITAVYSFMRFFPRTLPFDRFAEGTSTLFFMAKSFWAMPQNRALFAPSELDVQETSMFLSPIVFFGLLCLIWLFWKRRDVLLQRRCDGTLAAVYGGLLILFFTQLIRGHGALVTPLESLPVFSSLHVVVRFLYPFSIAVSILGVTGLMLWVRSSARIVQYEQGIIASSFWITIAALLFAYGPLLHSEELRRTVRYDRILERMESQDALKQPVTHVRWGGTFPFHVLGGTTGVRCYEPVFGYRGEHQVTSLTQGLAHRESGGFFNLNHPACFQYPKENGCKPGDRIAVSDRENFDRFRRGQTTTWKLSLAQKISDWVSLLSLLAIAAFLLSRGSIRRYNFRALWDRSSVG